MPQKFVIRTVTVFPGEATNTSNRLNSIQTALALTWQIRFFLVGKSAYLSKFRFSGLPVGIIGGGLRLPLRGDDAVIVFRRANTEAGIVEDKCVRSWRVGGGYDHLQLSSRTQYTLARQSPVRTFIRFSATNLVSGEWCPFPTVSLCSLQRPSPGDVGDSSVIGEKMEENNCSCFCRYSVGLAE